jgi:hypothetical protein
LWPSNQTKYQLRICETRKCSMHFWIKTDFSDPQGLGKRGPVFKYPECLIMFISILSVKLKIKSLQIHKMDVKYWLVIA